ncbi:MAG TPA: IS1 family transposase [Terracidiphilus sp.]|nr:IS1 family transposase [Terracidiphilus sp.]
MNLLSIAEKTQVIKCLCEGMSIRGTVRITGVAKNTVTNLLIEMGCACADYHHRNVRNMKVQRLQADEIWSFVGAKNKNASPEQKADGWGDVWTWTAIDADTKLCVTYYVGDRGKLSAFNFMKDAAARIIGKPQITTDSHRPYLTAVEKAFGGDADYAVLHKVFGATGNSPETRYSPATCIGCDMKTVSGVPDPAHVSTSYVERQNLTMRMSMRRFTRLTNAFSKKVENHGHAIALYFMFYNFCRVHQTLRVTPAMESGLSNHVWSVEELISLLPVKQAKKRGPYNKRQE